MKVSTKYNPIHDKEYPLITGVSDVAEHERKQNTIALGYNDFVANVQHQDWLVLSMLLRVEPLRPSMFYYETNSGTRGFGIMQLSGDGCHVQLC